MPDFIPNPNLNNPMQCKPMWSLKEMAETRLQYQADYDERLSLTESIDMMGPRFPQSIDDAVNIIVRQRHTIRRKDKYNAEQMDKLNLRISSLYSVSDQLERELKEANRQNKAIELDYNDFGDSMYRIIANKDAAIESLLVELAEAKKAEEVQSQAKWDAFCKVDDYRDAIDQLRAENLRLEAANSRLRKMVEDTDNIMWSIKQDVDNWSEKAEED